MFNAKEWLASMEPVVFIDLDGVEHKGKVVSGPEVTPLLDGVQKLQDGYYTAEKREEFYDFVRQVCKVVNIPAEKVLVLPQNGIVAAVLNLLGCLSGRKLETSAAPTP